MICPKCKTKLEDNVLRCTKCGTKVASVCKDCGKINPINAVECSYCHKILLKICTDCGAANLPDAKSCRKCGLTFDSSVNKTDKRENKMLEYSTDAISQQKVKSSLIDAIKDVDSSVITLCGESGTGKNLILRYVMNDLKNAKLVWLAGNCTQVTQLSPFGYFQDLFLTFFNINNFCPDTLQLKKNSMKFFKQDFPTLSNNEILDLLNFLYPESVDKYENIYKNKAKMFAMLKKVVMTIVDKVKAIFVIDSFENIDGMSLDFLKHLMQEEYILERCKFIITTKNSTPGLGLLPSPLLDESNYINLSIATFTDNQVKALITQYRDVDISDDYTKLIIKISAGNPAIVEQMVMLYKDIKRLGIKHSECNNLESLMQTRLDILRQEDFASYRMLCAMSVLGSKFYPAMLENLDDNSTKEFERIVDTLVSKGYINQISNLSFEFKSQSIWKAVVAILKNDEIFEDIINRLYEILSIYRQSSIALLGYIVQKLNNNDQSFNIWTMLMKQASYIGDISLYIISQKQALKLIEKKTSPQFQKIKKNIYTRVGKLLEPIDCNASFEYLQNAVMMLDDSEEYEHIDLLGYLASVSMKMGNYWGAVECAESVFAKIPAEMELERALIKSRTVKPLVQLGNYGLAIVTVENDTLPVIQKYLVKGKNHPVIDANDLFDVWLDLYFDLAEALTFQGDNKMFEVINQIFDIVEKNKITEPNIICKVNLALAFANTVKGDISVSEKILGDILKEFPLYSMDAFVVSRWNFIDILNKFLKQDYDNLTSELFNVVAYANNANDNFTKNILKTLLAKILKDKNDNKKALGILDEQVGYFAKEKIATGVLLSWYMIAEIKLVTKGTQFALDIATKALDIAQGPNINNYYFISLFNKLIGEIYIAKQDFESAKVYIEKSISMAKKYDLQDLLVQGYLSYAKYYQELALPKSTFRGTYIKHALKMFQQSKLVPIVSENIHLAKNIKDELNVLMSFCKMNGIVLKKISN